MYKPATLGKRAFAFSIDFLLLNIVTFPLVWFIGERMTELVIGALYAGLLYLPYFAIMEAKFGQTLGKMQAGIEVKFEEKNKMKDAVTRNLTKAATAFFPLFLVLDMLPIFFDKEKRRLSEMISKTRVIMIWKRSW